MKAEQAARPACPFHPSPSHFGVWLAVYCLIPFRLVILRCGAWAVLILRIRQAECALADGRLDEAFDLADRNDVRSHRRGQRLVGRVVRALVHRGTKHLDAGRLNDATADCDKARRLGGLMPEVAELRSKTADALLARHRAERQQARLVAAAQEQIDRGHLSAGGQLLAAVAQQESRAAVMLKDVEVRRAAIETATERAETAIRADNWEAALRELTRVRQADTASDADFAALVAKVAHTVRQRAHSVLEAGDLYLADAILNRLVAVDGHGVETQQLRHAVAQCRAAWACIDRSQPRQAEEIVRRIASLLPKASWPNTVAKQLRQAAELMDELRAGPLGLLSVTAMEQMSTQPGPMNPTNPRGHSPAGPANGRSPHIHPVMAPAMPSGEDMPSRFVLQVDGAGSYLVLTQPLVTIGPVSSPRVPDVGLMAEAGTSVATVERVEEDYFLRAAGPAAVNGRACSSKLLASGDELALSPRCRFTFRVPNVASTSAVLDLTGTRYPRADVRRVILLDRELVIGPGAGAHVRIDELTEKVVLHVRDGRLFVQTAQPVLAAERPVAPKTPVALGVHMKAGPVSFVVTRS